LEPEVEGLLLQVAEAELEFVGDSSPMSLALVLAMVQTGK
jgi:hypothetical protein